MSMGMGCDMAIYCDCTYLGTMLRADIINFWALRHIVLALTGAPAIQIDHPTLYIVTARISRSACAWHGHVLGMGLGRHLSHVCLTLDAEGTVGLGALGAQVAGLVLVGLKLGGVQVGRG